MTIARKFSQRFFLRDVSECSALKSRNGPTAHYSEHRSTEMKKLLLSFTAIKAGLMVKKKKKPTPNLT